MATIYEGPNAQHSNRFYLHLRYFLLVLFLIPGLQAAVSAQDCFIAGPYVLHADQSSVQVVWVTPAGIDAGTVHVKEINGKHEESVSAVLSVPLFQGLGGLSSERWVVGEEFDHLRHLAHITDLEAFTRYSYTVECGDGESEETGIFSTTPIPGEQVPFEFVVTSDGHSGGSGGSYYRIAERVGNKATDFVIHTGDLTNSWGAHWPDWLRYFRSARPYHASGVLVPVNGGHDLRPNRNYRAFFAFNDPDGDPTEEDEAPTYFTFQFGNADFFFLDYDYDHGIQLEWLREKVQESQADWKILALHRFTANVGSRGSFMTGIFYDFARMAEQEGIDFVLFGHDHLYERKIPIGLPGQNPVHYICLNSGGSLRAIRPGPVVVGGIGYRGFMYLHFHIDGKELVMEAINDEGVVLDRLELVKDENGYYQQEIIDESIELDLARTIAHIYTGQSMADDLRTQRSDILAQFSSLPKAGEAGTLLLNTGYTGDHDNDVSRFPVGSEVIVYEQSDPSGWRTEKQTIVVTGDVAVVHLTAPQELVYTQDGPQPPLELTLNIRVNGRVFEPTTVRPTLDGFDAIEKVDLIYPGFNMLVPLQPVFSWNEVGHVGEYQLQIASPRFSNIILDTLVSGTELKYPGELQPDQAHRWRVRGVGFMEGPWSDEIVFRTQQAVSAGPGEEIPSAFSLGHNYPNPFNPATTIQYALPVESRVELRVFDVIGREISVLVQEEQSAGHYQIMFDSGAIPSGVYQYRLEALPLGSGSHESFVQTRSMTLIK